MNGATHTTFGALTAGALAMTIGLSYPVGNATLYPLFTIAFSATGSLLPDIDMQQTTMGRKHKFISKWFTHRGMTHTLVFPAIIAVIAYVTTQMEPKELSTMLFNIVFALLWGWVMHIFADMFNGKGVPIFWPFISKRKHIATVTSDTWQEPVWLAFCFVAVGAYAFYKYGEPVMALFR